MYINIIRSVLIVGILITVSAASTKEVPNHSWDTDSQLSPIYDQLNEQNIIIKKQTTLIKNLYSEIKELEKRVTALEKQQEQKK